MRRILIASIAAVLLPATFSTSGTVAADPQAVVQDQMQRQDPDTPAQDNAPGAERGDVPALHAIHLNADGAVISAPGKSTAARAVGVLSKNRDPASIRMLSEMSDVLEHEPVQILPVLGKGPVHNVASLIYSGSIELAILPADVLAYLEAEGALFPGAKNVVSAVGRLYDEEFHLLARREIGSIEQLAGRRVAIDRAESPSHITAKMVFGALGVRIEPVAIDASRALERLKKRDIAAMVLVERKPARLFYDLNVDDRLHFLPVRMTPKLLTIYEQAEIRPADYPLLIPAGESGRGRPITTLKVGRVLAAFNWAPESDRFPAVQSAVEAIVRSQPTLKSPGHHPAWQESDLAQPVPGWTPYAGLNALAAMPTAPAGAREGFAGGPASVEGNADLRNADQLFREFLLWRERRATQRR
ncbi:MAG TPA: TAXI family TRAP transporter solute-binding subunit [Alphaproteobacteria bacterium]|nr:TAXI family TRAP transporter solute-binding subunit [Alphaproteobacteria bacterium]